MSSPRTCDGVRVTKQGVELGEQRRIGRQVRFDEASRRFVPRGRAEQSLSRERATRAGVGDEDRAPRGVEENGVRRFGAESGHGTQRRPQRCERCAGQTVEPPAALLDEPAREGLEAPRPAGGLDQATEARLADAVERARREQPLATERTDDGRGPGIEHDADGDLERRPPGTRPGRTEAIQQRSMDAQKTSLRHVARRAGNPAPAREYGRR